MLTNLNIATRLFVGFGALVVVIAVLGVTGTYSTRQSGAAALEVKRTGAIVTGLKDALLNVRQGRVLTWSYVATGDSSYLQSRDAAFATSEKQIAAADSLVATDAGHALIRDFREAVVDFEDKAKALEAVKTAGKAVDSAEFRAAVKDIDAAAKRYADTNNKAAAHQEEINTQAIAESDAWTGRATTMAVTGGLIGIALGGGLAWLIGKSISRPLQAMTTSMERLAGGDLDVTVPKGDGSEIGHMAQAVLVFKENALQVQALRQEQERAAQRAAEERKEAMNTLATDFEASVFKMVEAVSSSASAMQGTAGTMASAAEQTGSQATAVSQASDEATSNVQSVTAAAEELSASISEISRQASEASVISRRATEAAAHTDERVAHLAEAADRIGQVVKLINDIASQTNLLALNATIEAARAGDAGKGFAVVASEVKNLASQTGRATEEIGSQIAAVQEETANAVAAIKSIASVIARVEEISTSIASAVEQQGAATQDIAFNMQRAANGTHQVSANIGGVMAAASETREESGKVLRAAEDLRLYSDRLKAEVRDFLASVRAD